MKFLLSTLVTLFFAFKSLCSPLDDRRFKALAELESGTQDYRLGLKGEVSRYQIMPEIWLKYDHNLWTSCNPEFARGVAARIMADRVKHFKKVMHRAPVDFEWALLWHCPGRLARKGFIHNGMEFGYSIRFENLMSVTK